ncbi:MAG TPA: radical SAM protein [Chloroflexi bacterium]|nr:radical SAM protein [Chloroflexota bacterium]
MMLMDATEKLQLLATQMHLEPAEEADPRWVAAQSAAPGSTPPGPSQPERPLAPQSLDTLPCGATASGSPEEKKSALGIYQAVAPGGKPVALLKTLLTSACERDCYYCPFRARRNYRRATFKPEEMARTFIEMHRAGLVQGLFLSSGIAGGGVRTQDRLIATAEILRQTYGYRGYLHLKIMPGAEQAQIERVMQLADRVSINLEAPNSRRLQQLAPHKQFLDELLRPLQLVEAIRQTQRPDQAWNRRWPSSVTQFVVGGAGESDVELLTTTAHLYSEARLARAYFSAFSPVADTPLENRPAENPLREYRLSQSSFLLRDYGFDLEELPFTPTGNLPLDSDPKLAWAQAHLSETPIEVNRAGRQELLRIPGVGPKSADAILAARRRGILRNLRDLRAIGINVSRVAPFVLLDGRRPAHQLSLWEQD